MNKFSRILAVNSKSGEFLSISDERGIEIKEIITTKLRKTLTKNIIEEKYIWVSIDQFLLDCYNHFTEVEEKVYAVNLATQLSEQVLKKGSLDSVETAEYQADLLEQVLTNVKIVLNKDETFEAMSASSALYKILELAINDEI